MPATGIVSPAAMKFLREELVLMMRSEGGLTRISTILVKAIISLTVLQELLFLIRFPARLACPRGRIIRRPRSRGFKM